MRKVVILGATGSIGRQALEVVRANPNRFEVIGLAAGSDERALARLGDEFPRAATELGAEGAARLARLSRAEVVLNAIVGADGLTASLAALETGKILALANKESLVAGGRLCLEAARRGGGMIVPVDSEHAAIAQLLEGRDRATIESIVLTASGGPFRGWPADLSQVTVEQALTHPTWSMGPKITVDSATLMNKGLEIIEAHYLFGFPYERIEVVVHPESVVHALLRMVDGSYLMQAAAPDMRLPIQNALTYPDRISSMLDPLAPAELGSLAFEPVDLDRFPAIHLAYDCGRNGRSYPAVMNAANEMAVGAFLDGRLRFDQIIPTVAAEVEEHEPFDLTHPADLQRVLDSVGAGLR